MATGKLIRANPFFWNSPDSLTHYGKIIATVTLEKCPKWYYSSGYSHPICIKVSEIIRSFWHFEDSQIVSEAPATRRYYVEHIRRLFEWNPAEGASPNLTSWSLTLSTRNGNRDGKETKRQKLKRKGTESLLQHRRGHCSILVHSILFLSNRREFREPCHYVDVVTCKMNGVLWNARRIWDAVPVQASSCQ